MTPPSAPQNARAQATSETAVEIAWDAAADDVAVSGYEVIREQRPALKVAAPPAAESGLRAATQYCYTVRSYDAAGNRSPLAGPVCATTPDTTPPAPPGSLEAAAADETRIELRWHPSSDNVGVSGYELRRGDLPPTTVQAARADDQGLRAWTEYCYAVLAFDGAGNRSRAAGPVCARTRDVTPPSAPSKVEATPVLPDRIELRWSAATDNGQLAGYEVRRDAKVVAKGSELAAAETGLRPGVAHCYVVTALDAAGNRSPDASPACATVPDVTPPSTPGDVVATPRSETEIELRWSASTDDQRVEGYEIQSGGRLVAKAAEAPGVAGGLRPTVSYCFTVRARDPAGNLSRESAAACATTPDRTPPGLPPGFVAAATSDTAVKLRWQASKDNVGVTGYEVTRDGAVLRSLNALELADAGLKPATRYCYEVRALDAAGNRSDAAGPSCVTTPDVTPPTRPGKLEIATASGKITLAWAASTDDVGVAGYEVMRQGKVVASVTDPAHTESGLERKRHCYSVRAFDAAGNRSPETEPACAVPPDVTPPSAPTQLRVRTLTEVAAELRWTASTDNVAVTGYELLRGGSLVATVARPGAQDGALAPYKEYCWTARALDAAGNRSEESEPVCARTPDLTPPTLPGALAATSKLEEVVELRWPAGTDNVGVVGYEIERDGAPVAKTTDPRLDDVGRRAGTRYCYVVRARDAAGHASEPAQACVVTADLTPPSPPSALQAAPTATQVALRWTESTDNVAVTGYEVLRGRDVVVRVAAVVAVSSGLSPDTEYCHSVRALDAAGNRSSAVGPLCTTTIDPSKPPAPQNLALAPSSAGVALRWSASPRKDVVYRIYGEGQSVGATRYLTYEVKAPEGWQGCFRVTAVDASGRESPRSNEACVERAPPVE